MPNKSKMEEDKLKLYIYEYNQCNPKKCSGHRLVKFNKSISIPIKNKFNGIVLSPNTNKIISKKDLKIVQRFGLCAIDCSWNQIKEFNFSKIPWRKSNERCLPFLYAGNPINYGKPYKLNCLEAYSASLYILGYKNQAFDLFEGFSYKTGFFNLNKTFLERYERCKTTEDILKIMELTTEVIPNGFL